MMVVITLSNCPAKLRGDLTKWLFEIDTNVFVGNLSARVRDEVWMRICDNIKNGRAAMAFSSNSEQKLDFRIHNTNWEPVDFDGLKLVRRNVEKQDISRNNEMTKAEIFHQSRIKQRLAKPQDREYVVINVETTGIGQSDKIIELAAIYVKNGTVEDSMSALIKCDILLPEEIVELTGITDEMLSEEGLLITDALKKFCEFCGDKQLVGHNINFDMRFIQKECMESGISQMQNKLVDTMKLARKKLDDVKGYSLQLVAEYFGIDDGKFHRALDDCMVTYRIFEKLNEN